MKVFQKKRISMLSVFLVMAMLLTNTLGSAGAGLIAHAETIGVPKPLVSQAEPDTAQLLEGNMQLLPEADTVRVPEGDVHPLSEADRVLQSDENAQLLSEGTEAALSGISLQIDQEYAVVGTPLTVTLSGIPAGTACKYQWKVAGTVKSTEDSYVPADADLEKMLTITVTTSGSHTGTYQASMYLSKLPVLYVDTENSQQITSKEDYINGSFRIQGNAEYNSTNTTLYDGAIEIRGRGNSTWQNPKKPYKIKLDKKTDIFGFGQNKHWVLLANYTDESHMRNTLSYDLSGSMGMPYMQNVHVDLILNGQYQGTYQFCEQVKIADGRVNIHNWEDYAEDVAKAVYKAESANGLTKDDQDAIEIQLAEKNMSWLTTKKFTYQGKEYDITKYLPDMPDATGGFLVELDAYYDEYSKFMTSQNQPLQFKNPEFIATGQAAIKYVEDYVNAFERAIQSANYTTTYNNEKLTYSQLFDMDSLTQFWLVSELFMNVDAMKKSTYLYKDLNGLFHMGPIWDMDWSSNSLVSNYEGSGVYNAWQTHYFSAQAQAKQWYKSIVCDPYFAVQVYELYTKMREELGSIVADGGKIDTYQSLLLESANANASMWYGGDSQRGFTAQVQTLKTYLKNRLNWLDKQFQSPETLAASLGYRSAGGISISEDDITTQKNSTTVITATVSNTDAKSVEFLINGKNQGTATVSNQKATLEIPTEILLPSSSYNTVQVFALNSANSVITSGGTRATDYEKFYAEFPEDLDKPVDPDNPDKPVDPDNPDKPVDPDDSVQPAPPSIKVPAKGKVLSDTKGKAQYKVTKSGLKGGTVEYYKNKNTKAAAIKIPDTITIGKITYKVTGIAETALKGNKKATKITIGNNVTQIKKNTFSQCTKLKAITLGKNVTSIGDKAFYKCTALTQIVIPSKVTKIGKQSFYGCEKLTKALISAKVTSIGSKAFASTPKLKSIVIKTTRLTSKTIGSNAFQKINSQATIKVPAKKLKSYKTLLKKRGISGKKQKIVKQ